MVKFSDRKYLHIRMKRENAKTHMLNSQVVANKKLCLYPVKL